MELFNKLTETVTNLQSDAEKFFNKENSAAGTRLRKGLQEIKKIASDLRKEVTATKESRKGQTTTTA